MTAVVFEKGKNSLVLVYADSSKRIIWTGASVKMWMHKHINEVSSWLMGAGWKREEVDGENLVRIMQSLFPTELPKESKEEL
jgi:hypothetical protein